MTHQDHRAAARLAVVRAQAKRSWSNADLTSAARVAPGTIADFLSGARWPKAPSLAAIDRAFGWPPGTLAAIGGGLLSPDDVDDSAPAPATFTPPPRPASVSPEDYEAIIERAMAMAQWDLDRLQRGESSP